MLKKLVEFNSFVDVNLGDTLTTELFEEGDYVDRGLRSVDVIVILLALKVRYIGYTSICVQ